MEHLFTDLPDSVPLWLELKRKHEIRIHFDTKSQQVIAMKNGMDPEAAHDERTAVVSLIHNNLLEGWQSVSVTPPSPNYYESDENETT
ncbi:MAG: hypothetical protein ACPGES_02470 [Coraliomargarita sp.]